MSWHLAHFFRGFGKEVEGFLQVLQMGSSSGLVEGAPEVGRVAMFE